MSQSRRPSQFIVFITVFIDLVGFGLIIPLNPYLAREFGASPLQVGLLMTIYSAMQFAFSPLWGQLSDRFGRRPIILMSLFGSAIFHSLFAFSNTYLLLFIARALAGAFGGNISAAMAYMADITEQKDRSKAMGLIGAAFGIGFVLGPVIGGLSGPLGLKLGSQPPFGYSFGALIAAGICLLNFIFAYFVLVESHTPTPTTSAVRESRIKKIFDSFRRPVLGPLMFTGFLGSLALAHMEASLFLYVSDIFNWSVTKASFGFGYVGIIMAITQGGLIRRLIPKLGEPRLLVSGLALSSLGYFFIGMSHQIWLLAVAVTLLGLGNGFYNPSLTGSLSLLSGKDEQGGILGTSQSLAALGRIIGPATGGYIYSAVGPSWPFFVSAILALIAIGSCSTIYAKLPKAGMKVG